jgi:hypothetical protein
LEIDENTAPTVRWIFESAAYQGYGFNKIARVLSEKQVLTPTAGDQVAGYIAMEVFIERKNAHRVEANT